MVIRTMSIRNGYERHVKRVRTTANHTTVGTVFAQGDVRNEERKEKEIGEET